MNEDIHPNWHTTDDEEVPVRVIENDNKEEQVEEIPVHTSTISRKPAAIVGILLVIGIATLFFQGVQSLTGQLAGGIHIRITDAGFIPQSVNAAPGETLTWVNEVTVPQYVISDTLCNTQNECLNTSTMFQDDTADYTIPGDVSEGTYDYFSPTDPSLTGTINISGSPISGNPQTPTGDGNPPDAFSLAQQQLLDSIQRQLELDAGSQQPPPSDPFTPPPTQIANTSGVPQNPYTVGSNNQFPFNPDGNPVGGSFDNVPPPASNPPTFGRGVQRPFRQADTGPGLWIVLALSTLLIWRVTRKASPAFKA